MDGVVTANLSELRLTPVAKLQIGIRAAMKDVEIGVHQAPIAREYYSNGLSPRRLTQTIAAISALGLFPGLDAAATALRRPARALSRDAELPAVLAREALPDGVWGADSVRSGGLSDQRRAQDGM